MFLKISAPLKKFLRTPLGAGRGDFWYCSHWLTWLASSTSILHSDLILITSGTKCNRGIYMFHWLLVAPQALRSLLSVEDSFSNKEMCTFSRIRAHQSTSETLTQVYEGEKQSQLLSTASPLWFWWRIRHVVHFHDKFLSFLCCGTSYFKNDISLQCQKEPVSYFNWYSRIFPVYWLTRGPRDRSYHCLQW